MLQVKVVLLFPAMFAIQATPWLKRLLADQRLYYEKKINCLPLNWQRIFKRYKQKLYPELRVPINITCRALESHDHNIVQ
jgi:hypothetical protein